MKKTILAFGILGASSMALAGGAKEPGNYWSHDQAFTTTSTCVRNSTVAGSGCALFPAGWASEAESFLATFQGSAAYECTWVFDYATAPSANHTIGTGKCGGFRVGAAGQVVFTKPSRTRLIKKQSCDYRVGLCDVAYSSGGDSLYATCAADADCTDYGGGTCSASPTLEMERNAGLFLHCIADSAATGTIDKGIVE